jgi:long-chain acyl-CoA synthetase
MVLNPKVLKLLREEVARCNAELSDHQQARRFHVVHQEWTAEGGELTPTLKPRRELLRAQFQKEIDALYNEK